MLIFEVFSVCHPGLANVIAAHDYRPFLGRGWFNNEYPKIIFWKASWNNTVILLSYTISAQCCNFAKEECILT